MSGYTGFSSDEWNMREEKPKVNIMLWPDETQFVQKASCSFCNQVLLSIEGGKYLFCPGCGDRIPIAKKKETKHKDKAGAITTGAPVIVSQGVHGKRKRKSAANNIDESDLADVEAILGTRPTSITKLDY